MIAEAVLKPGGDAATALYIVAFSLFILGLKRGTHPTTAKQGNMVAAVGMAVAVVTTLLLDGIGNWGLIALGLGIGTAVGVVASIRVQMTNRSAAAIAPIATIHRRGYRAQNSCRCDRRAFRPSETLSPKRSAR